MLRAIGLLLLLAAAGIGLDARPATAAPERLLPWQQWVEKPVEETAKPLAAVFDLPWASTGGKEGVLSRSQENGPWGGPYFRFQVKIDYSNGQGWPAFEVQPRPNLDFSGYGLIRYWIRCETKLEREQALRFILWTDGAGRINERIPGVRPGRWIQVTHSLAAVPRLDRVERLHFFLSENEYDDGDEMTFEIGGFQLLETRRELEDLAAGQAAMALWVGERGDSSERIVIRPAGTRTLPALLVLGTGPGVSLRPSDTLRLKLYEVFSKKTTWHTLRLGRSVPAGRVTRLRRTLTTGPLPPGYYLVTLDVRRAGKSLLDGRVGADDLYVRKQGESMTYTVLSLRTGMVLWLRDLLHGDIMGWCRAALPHTYDPLNRRTYAEFLRLYADCTWKHTEGNEAGDTGLALAAEAFRKSGDLQRARFAEWLLDDSIRHMITKMQAPSGGTIMMTNELEQAGIGRGGGVMGFGSYDSNQIGEWMRALTYAIIHYSRIPDRRAHARALSAACRKSADYLVAHSLQESDGIPHVLRHLTLNEQRDGSVQQVTYYQEGRQCDVYLGRALAGLSYYAYARQLLGEPVPPHWFTVMDNTVRWCDRKMKSDGWFDWQCEDLVEGGCHTFLGNIYVGEGIFGVYLANRLAGREASADYAAEVARKAYRYVTDHCTVKGVLFRDQSAATEFWVGPYVYWLFTEYLDTVGPEPVLAEWLRWLDRTWSVEREWRDFLDRPRDETGYVGRAAANGMLSVALLGYLGIKQMEEVGKPLHWRVQPEQ